jgi:hypothetical protein
MTGTARNASWLTESSTKAPRRSVGALWYGPVTICDGGRMEKR